MSPHQKDADMKAHISQWKKSGLTQVAYCNEHDIKPHIFSYYKGKLNRADSSQRSNGLIPIDLISNTSTLLTSTIDSATIKLSHNNGFSLEFNTSTELSSLKPLLHLVRSIT